jgi:hypothetical protein
LTVDLPNAAGKVVPFFTYDGYLEEPARQAIRTERRSFEKLKVTGAAIFGFLGYFVPIKKHRPHADSIYQYFTSRDSQSPQEGSSLELLQVALVTIFLLSMDTPDSTLLSENSY